MSAWEGVAQGLIGAVGGAGKGMAQVGEDETKAIAAKTLKEQEAEIQARRDLLLQSYKETSADNAIVRERNAKEESAGRVNERAGLIAASRKVTSPEVDAQAGAAADAYNAALQRGEITDADATNAAKAITEYSDNNAKPDTKVTTKDKVQASAELGQISWKDVASLEGKDAAQETRMKIAEMQNALGLQRMDAQTQIAIAKMDAAYSKIQSGSKDPADVQTMRFALDEINKSRADEGKPKMSLEELLRSGLLGKSGEGSTETVKTDDSGMVLERTVTNRTKGKAEDSQKFTPRAEYDKLPVGATYTGPDGKQYKKGK